ncbi:hypothetical protein N7516_003690 [Penicillium verrucosum]|uniref:uncharacterized protein n=1 Tax=Penicillium verrucosum TaxID=60171 RepID=UPI002545575A|nr:uncharacterized protein N7516_003690 [Penicillium verrucosum]KAJ5943522.1 hypothetical protein N7516_003690 [Penicillium verrucosum]
MPLNLGPLLLEGLAGEKHVGSFTLTPDQDLAGQFFGGSHYRLNGLDPTLKGALPKSEFVADGIVVLHLEISTSGIYNDIQQGKVFHFSSAPQLRRCSYEVNEAGERGVTRDHPIFDSTDHAEPTPFTQWKIKVLNPEEFDLSGLTGVDLDWKGHVRFDPTRKLQ